MKRAVFSILVLIFANEVLGYDWGDPLTSCITMRPKNYFDMTAIQEDDYYRLVTSVDDTKTFYPGQEIHIRLMGKTNMDRKTYEGLFLTVRRIISEGTWHEFHSSKYKRLNCWQQDNSALAEANERTKYVEDDVFIWTAPGACPKIGPVYELKGAVVKNKTHIFTGLSVLLTCVAKPTMPARQKDACKENYYEFPNGTSFEDGFGGWWNSPMAAMRWSRHMGKTPTPFTGPSAAYDGDYYIYSEASTPAKEGDVAILNSPPGLKGCICIRFMCHLWGGPGTYFSARRDGIELWRHTPSADEWFEGHTTLYDAENSQAQMVAIRGSDFRGDIAVDKVTYHPGICKEDMYMK